MPKPRSAGVVLLASLAVFALGASGAGAAARVGRTAHAARPGGLVQAGNSKTTCIYATLGSQMRAAERATGVTYRCVEVFNTGDPNWVTWASPWLTQSQFGYTRWVAADSTRRTIILTQNLVPNNVAKLANWRSKGASGAYDTYVRRLARNLVSAGLGYAVVRLGPEMNGPWESDWIGSTVTQERQWALYFARIVRIMRAVPGAHFLFDWNVNAGYQNIPLARYYPGDAYVDIVGIDAYDESPIPRPPVGSSARWRTLTTEPLGLLEIYNFARAHHKPASIPEWGTVSTYGDDGAYVAAMAQFVKTHVVAYESWFDAGHDHILQLDPVAAPKTLGAYVSGFGPRSLIGRYQR